MPGGEAARAGGAQAGEVRGQEEVEEDDDFEPLDPFDENADWGGLPEHVQETDLVTWLIPHAEVGRALKMTPLQHAKFFEWAQWKDRGKQAVAFPAGTEHIEYHAWWNVVKPLRSMDQWRTKLTTFGLSRGYVARIISPDLLGDVVLGTAMAMGGLRAHADTGVKTKQEPHFGVPHWM